MAWFMTKENHWIFREASFEVRVVLVGVVSSAEAAFDGLVYGGADIVAILTSDVEQMVIKSKMERGYFTDFRPLARHRNIPLWIVDDINNYAEEIAVLEPDLIYVIGWPQLVRESVLSIAPCIGMHPAPLPKRRGGAPLNWQIIDGERQSAVSLIRLGTGVDDGDILIQLPFEIEDSDYIDDVMKKMNELTYQGVKSSYVDISSGGARWVPQDHSRATVMRRRRPEDGLIGWKESARRICNLVRAVSHPFPGAFTYVGNQLITVWRAEIPQGYIPKLRAFPGEVLGLLVGKIVVSCRDYCIAVSEIQIGENLPVHSGSDGFDAAFEFLRGRVLGLS